MKCVVYVVFHWRNVDNRTFVNFEGEPTNNIFFLDQFCLRQSTARIFYNNSTFYLSAIPKRKLHSIFMYRNFLFWPIKLKVSFGFFSCKMTFFMKRRDYNGLKNRTWGSTHPLLLIVYVKYGHTRQDLFEWRKCILVFHQGLSFYCGIYLS